ncbi:translocation/assembly module TamB domain-containing protein [Arenibacter algicola]|uniref:translocation/assembly module TamB domain-containing protein n=1 Tax=Arenibacter algicola TaxID=616991 RepID=UPI001C07471C|nr:translocation/assembly module TamB [Arenibacter algicola]MBU2904023.1 translocation/assembly module TamB domain-containing protein [Arenibacter algicola]
MKTTKSKYRFFRRAAKVVLVLSLLFIVLVLIIRSPWAQNFIVNKATNYISSRTNTKVEIDQLFITFSGNAFLEGLYLEDKKGDTLLYTKSLEANIPLRTLLFQNELNLKSLKWEGLRAQIERKSDSEKFNYQFLIDALATEDTISQQSNTAPMKVKIGTLDFSDFKISYNDRVSGLEAKLDMGTLYLNANKTDLETMHYELDEVALSDTKIQYKQSKPFAPQDNPETKLPFLVVNELNFNNILLDYNSIPDNVIAAVRLGEFRLDLPKADLTKNEVEIELLSLKNSDFSLQLQKDNLEVTDSSAIAIKKSDFSWPDFALVANKISLENNSVQYRLNNATSEAGHFNPNNVALSNLTLNATDLNYQPKNASLNIDRFLFMEKSGFVLNQLAMHASLNDTSASISELKMQTASSVLNGEFTLDYPSIQKLIDSPGNTKVDLQLKEIKLALQDALYFQPALAENEYFTIGQQHPIIGNLNIQGTINDLNLPKLNLNWSNTTLTGEGHLFQLTESDSLSFDISTLKATSTIADLQLFVTEKDLNMSLPQTILVEARAQGGLKNVSGEALVKIPEGTAQITGNYSNLDTINFSGSLQVSDLQLGKLLKNDQLGTMAFTINASGSGSSLNTLNAEMDSKFDQLTYKNYDFANLDLNGKIRNGKGNINLNFKDENLNFTSQTVVDLDSSNSKYGLNLNVIGADLQALGVTTENIKAGLDMEADFTGNPKDFSLNALVKNGVAVYDGQQYQIGEMEIKSKIDTLNTEIAIISDFLTGNLYSNGSPQGINTSLKQYFKNYFQDSIVPTSAADTLKLKMDLKLIPNSILTEVFIKDLEQLDSISAHASFDAANRTLVSDLQIPYARYNGMTLDSLSFSINGDATNLNFKAGLANLLADPVDLGRTSLEGRLDNRQLLLDFSSYDGNEKITHIASEMTLAKDTTLLHIDPLELIFNKKEWTIPEDNQISIAENFLEFNKVTLERNIQKLSLVSVSSETEEKPLRLTFEQFKLQTFIGMLNPDRPLASGIVNGDFTLENLFGATGIVADFNVTDLEILEHALGNLSLNANSKTNGTYDFNLALKGGGADIDLNGDYAASETGAQLNLDMDLNRIDLQFIEKFSQGNLKDSHGTLSGNIDVSGTTTSPIYSGSVNFHDVDFNVATLNSVFRISDETLKIDNKGIYLDNFQITDANGSNFKMNGSIGTEELTNPKFNISLNAEQFQALNSTKDDNELFYGKSSFDLDLSVKGYLKLPIIEGRIRVRKITDITYVVPKEQLDVQEREGVVLFVNRENPDAILTRNDQEETPAFFSGMDVNVILEIADDSDFNIIIDERTGDNLKVSGNATLNLNIKPNGSTNLTGRYELNSGHYETSLYNLVKRRFEINPGSTIVWQGDPTDAKLNVTAVYEVETSATPLMSSVISGEDISVINKYRQVLPFLVYLNVDGELLQPKLSFRLDMPEDEQGSLGGAVYGRVQQLNQQEAELNKQVFSLLALNRFYPDSGSDGSMGGTAAIARDNVNKVLSGQINAFSDKVFGKSGFEVDFDLDSFTDYQGDSPQDRTQLNINAKKKLFDDRLVVTAGSAVDVEGSAQPGQDETPIIGNVSLEYLLTKDGRYRLRGFRKNEYENIIDGQLIVTGIALIFNREFNKFSQLFNPLKETGTTDDKEKGDQKK